MALAAGARGGEAASGGADSGIAAEALFKEGMRLVEAGDYVQGCSKLAESQRLDPAPGTEMNLADCYERQGRLATAWATFLDAQGAAERGHRPAWAAMARERAQKLEARVSTLVVRVPDAERVRGLSVMRDGSEVSSWAPAAAVPVDPGDHVLDARAPGYLPWRSVVHVDRESAQIVVDVPPLAPEPAPTAPPTAVDARAGTAALPNPGERRVRAIDVLAPSALAASAISVGVGAYFGVAALVQTGKATALCSNPPCADDRPVQYARDAHWDATASTVAFIAGGAFLATGATLLVLRGKNASAHVAVTPTSLTLSGRW
ncbi:MAG TPA: hypothetical protein VGI39_41980 [Polyangiaceae bacterium]|jgi:hypothetical protein